MQRSTLAFVLLFAACGTLEVNGGGNPDEAPTVASITPARGPVAGGNEVTISGTGFVEGTAVVIGGIETDSTTIESDTSIRVTVPNGANVETPLDVLVFGPAGFAELPRSYTYNRLPTLDGLSAKFGPLAGGATIELSGAFLQTNNPGTPTITIAGLEATDVEVLDDSTIRFQSPVATGDLVALRQDLVLSTTNGDATLEDVYTFVRPGLLTATRLATSGTGIFYLDIETKRSVRLVDPGADVARFFVEGDGKILFRHHRDIDNRAWSRVDLQTGQTEFIGQLSNGAGTTTVRGTTKVGDSLVALADNTLGIVDPLTMRFNPISGASFNQFQGCLAAKSPTEIFHMESVEGRLSTVNINTGIDQGGPILTPSVAIPNAAGYRCHGAAVVGGQLFALFIDQFSSRAAHLFSINTTDGTATEIATLPDGFTELEPTPPGFFQ
tara:strand:- start:22922 stop:24241 length:1320 start_codon:yes stop_codon:yes gene_type:complete